MIRRMYILRGVSGSGKSEVAQELTAGMSPASYEICSTIDYMTDGEGTFRWDARKLTELHLRNQADVQQACRRGVELVVVDNTNVHRWEMAPYEDIARNYGYRVHVLTVEPPRRTDGTVSTGALHARQIHSVPIGAIERQLSQFEH